MPAGHAQAAAQKTADLEWKVDRVSQVVRLVLRTGNRVDSRTVAGSLLLYPDNEWRAVLGDADTARIVGKSEHLDQARVALLQHLNQMQLPEEYRWKIRISTGE